MSNTATNTTSSSKKNALEQRISDLEKTVLSMSSLLQNYLTFYRDNENWTSMSVDERQKRYGNL